MNTKTFVAITVLSISALQGFGQELQNKYRVVNRTITPGTSPGSVHVNEVEGAGIAWITGETFIEGTIEFDIKGKDAFQQSFVGIAFHGLNDTTYEAIYFRPFNFKSSDPNRQAHAVQYIANPLYDWPKLRALYPNKYEQPVSPPPDPNDWFHARIVIEPQKISVFVNSNNKPALVVEPLVSPAGSQIGLWVGNGSSGDWKNLTITRGKQ